MTRPYDNPLLVGIFTHVMLQVYLERITHHQFSGSFFAFTPIIL